MAEEHYEELGRKLSDAAEGGDEEAKAVLDRMTKYREDPDDDDLDWLSEAAIRWESDHPELANVAARLVNALTAGGF